MAPRRAFVLCVGGDEDGSGGVLCPPSGGLRSGLLGSWHTALTLVKRFSASMSCAGPLLSSLVLSGLQSYLLLFC